MPDAAACVALKVLVEIPLDTGDDWIGTRICFLLGFLVNVSHMDKTILYGFLIAGLLITMGTLGDRIGRRRLLLIGAAAFGCASILAAFSNTAEMLILSRAILGISGATPLPFH